MEIYNKYKKVYKSYDLDSILSMDISDRIKDEYRSKFGKKVYFEHNGKTQVGRLIGMETNYQFSNLYYIITALNSDDKYYLDVEHSITLLQ